MFLDPFEASVEEKLDLEGENGEAVREVARTGEAGGERGEDAGKQHFSGVIASQEDSTTSNQCVCR